MTSTRADWQVATDVVDAALVTYARKPSDRDIADLTRQLLHLGGLLLPNVAQLPGSTATVADWESLKTAGPSDGPLGTWTHARGLARTVRRMLQLLDADAR
ncbi:DUF6415 family natural product biosynthesis protein [Streptomyces sp. NPDC041003]|uniref:DUF6415 family natural product biosynthesis protein n=1 Tax=Streptomyces sp. NPDC041003 TaxID=3155730 RepID=UPI00340007C7